MRTKSLAWRCKLFRFHVIVGGSARAACGVAWGHQPGVRHARLPEWALPCLSCARIAKQLDTENINSIESDLSLVPGQRTPKPQENKHVK